VTHPGRLAELEWRDDFCVGEPTIDAQHKGFIDQAKRVGSLIAAEAPVALILANIAAMVVATEHHFATEDAILVERGFPDIANHRIDHSVIYDQVANLVSPLTVHASVEEMVTVVRGIVAILLEHMLLKDMEFRPFLRDGTGGFQAWPASPDSRPRSMPSL